MSSREREQFHRQGTSHAVTLVDYQDDLASCIAAADLSVSMGGYNTICEILSAGTPAVVVPRIFPRREQYIRAQRLAAHGLIDVVLPGELTPEGLARRVRDGLAAPCKPRGSISLDGGRRAAELVLSLLETPGSRTHSVPVPAVARSGRAGW
jgi:predicted glycosyltransferase